MLLCAGDFLTGTVQVWCMCNCSEEGDMGLFSVPAMIFGTSDMHVVCAVEPVFAMEAAHQ